MFAFQVADYGEQAIAFSAIGFFKRPRAVRQFGRRGPRLDVRGVDRTRQA